MVLTNVEVSVLNFFQIWPEFSRNQSFEGTLSPLAHPTFKQLSSQNVSSCTGIEHAFHFSKNMLPLM